MDDESLNRLLDQAFKDQKEATRWWYFCTLMTEEQRSYMLNCDKKQWNDLIDHWYAQYDTYLEN